MFAPGARASTDMRNLEPVKAKIEVILGE